MNNKLTKTWQQYEAGKEYKRRISLYETVRRNERYYRGDQWSSGGELPKPVFNLVRRISDYMVSTVASGKITVRYTDESLPFAVSSIDREMIRLGTEALTQNASYRWERCKMDHRVMQILRDAGFTEVYMDPTPEDSHIVIAKK